MNTDKITIALTDARPIRVTKALWPLVAKAAEDRDHNNQELFRRYYIRVRLHGSTSHVNDANEMAYYGMDKAEAPRLRMHRDQRCIVTAEYSSSWQGEHGAQAGYVCTLDEAPECIRQAAQQVGCPEHLIVKACEDLPAVEEIEVEDLTTEELAAELLKRKQAEAIAAEQAMDDYDAAPERLK